MKGVTLEYFKKLNLEITDTSQYSSAYIKAIILIRSFSVNSKQLGPDKPEIDTIFSKLDNIFNKYLPLAKRCNDYESRKWIDNISPILFTHMKNMFDTEMNSTAYILKVIGNSVIGEKIIITIDQGDIKNIKGKWENDKRLFRFKIPEGNINNRLIMGFGPSASGKTYWAENIIKILSEKIENFPKTFITIDGGEYREYSQVYQLVVEQFKGKGYGGFNQLVLASFSITKKSLFDSSKIKKVIINYLSNYRGQISLYVPETLGDCGNYRPYSCGPKIQKYIEITGDNNYIGLMIYQHKTGLECTMDTPYKCVGCTESGKMREIDEGKKYSSMAYEHSYSEGERQVKNARTYRFMIHNSGGKKTGNSYNKSIFFDLSNNPIISDKEYKKKFEETYNCIYKHKNDPCSMVEKKGGKNKNSRKRARKTKRANKSRRTRRRRRN